MKFRSVVFLLFCSILFQFCASTSSRIDKINSKVSFDDLIKVDNVETSNQGDGGNLHQFLNNQTSSEFIDSIKQKLLIDREVLVDIKYQNLTNKISFQEAKDTIYLTKMKIKSASGGLPIIYEYNVMKNDVVFYEFENNSRHKLESISLQEGETTRFRQENFKRRNKIKGSFIVTSDNTLKLVINNDNIIKNLGLFKSKLNLKIKTLGSVKLISEIVSDTIFTRKIIMETIYDTIYNIESNYKFNLASKRTITNQHTTTFPLLVGKGKDIIAWSYWIGLQDKDTLDMSDAKNNLISTFAKNELNNSHHNVSSLISKNDELEISINNETFDRRSLNFSNNFALYRVDNNYSDKNIKGEITISNKSNLYDYGLQFVFISISLKDVKTEVEKEIGEIKKYVKLNLEYNE